MNQIKSVQEDRWLKLALMQHIKYGQTIFVAPDSLAIDQEGFGPYRFRSTNDCREAVRPVIATTGEEAYAVSVPADQGAVSLKLDLMKPIGAGRRIPGRARKARPEEWRAGKRDSI
jgi:hypothetical protein